MSLDALRDTFARLRLNTDSDSNKQVVPESKKTPAMTSAFRKVLTPPVVRTINSGAASRPTLQQSISTEGRNAVEKMSADLQQNLATARAMGSDLINTLRSTRFPGDHVGENSDQRGDSAGDIYNDSGVETDFSIALEDDDVFPEEIEIDKVSVRTDTYFNEPPPDITNEALLDLADFIDQGHRVFVTIEDEDKNNGEIVFIPTDFADIPSDGIVANTEVENDDFSSDDDLPVLSAEVDSDLPDSVIATLLLLQQSEEEYYIDLFIEYCRIWAMKIGNSLRDNIHFGLARYIHEATKEMPNSSDDVPSTMDDDDVCTNMGDDIAALILLSDAKWRPDDPDRPYDLDYLTALLEEKLDLPKESAQRYAIPWIMRDYPEIALKYFPNDQEWVELVKSLSENNGAFSRSAMMRIRQQQEVAEDANERQPIAPTLSEAALRKYLEELHPITLKIVANTIPITGPQVATNGIRTYVINRDQLRKGAAFAPPMAYDLGEEWAHRKSGKTGGSPSTTPKETPNVILV